MSTVFSPALVFLGFLFSAHFVFASMSMQDYLNAYLNDSEVVEQAQTSTLIQEASLQKSADLFSTSFDFSSFSKSQTKEFQLSSHETENLKYYKLGLSQSLGFGNSLNINYTNYDDFTTPQYSYEDWGWELSFSQSLWKNFFGVQDRLKIDAESERLIKAEAQSEEDIQASCRTGAMLYLEAFSSKSKLDFASETDSRASQALKIAESSFKKRLIKRIHLLSARADRKNTRAQKELALRSWQEAKESLVQQARISTVVENIVSPEDFFNSLDQPILDLDLKTNFSHKAALANEKAKQLDYKTSMDQNKVDVILGLSHKRRQIYANSQASNTENIEDSYNTISLSVSTPLWSKTQKADEDSARLNWKLSEWQRRASEKNIKDKFEKAKIRYKHYGNLLSLSKEKIDLYKLQLSEANKLLRKAKLEFVDYLKYRDQLYSEELNRIDLKSAFWNEKMYLMSFHSQWLKTCKVYRK